MTVLIPVERRDCICSKSRSKEINLMTDEDYLGLNYINEKKKKKAASEWKNDSCPTPDLGPSADRLLQWEDDKPLGPLLMYLI